MGVRAINENVNYFNQMQIQNHLMNVGEVENRMKQNANIYNMLPQIQQRRRQTDFHKFLENIFNQNQIQRKYTNGVYSQTVPFPKPWQIRWPMLKPPPPLTQVNIKCNILENSLDKDGSRKTNNSDTKKDSHLNEDKELEPELIN